ncbi:tetratricopeptide repeat protein [Gelidibacter gilvus]|uniref:Tetratricopeptide repeat protein n=1 Tax=Gelidibacter gilvus TaxID=59602 RepID=A0A4Q0XKY1_9FLAO|nr:tetratricopeptide repeat protein [Gelidibacter gilvus]RXJ52485.1 tetratricopeptide repeat protein [Gelidibacter gilvus]
MKKIIQELQRRNVIKSALAYLVFAWLITQVMAIIIPAFDLHTALLKTAIVVLSIGFPLWLIFSWVYEITPDGIKKTVDVDPEVSIAPQTSNRLNYVIIAGLVIVIGLLIKSNLFPSASAENEPKVVPVEVESDKSIAVLAFADMSPEKDQEYFSDGISEEILNLLVKIPNLKVISRTSSFSYKGKDVKIKKIGEELHVNHVLEGSIRKSGNTFRITAQLIDVNTGAHIWSETYDRQMEDIFKIQDEIATKVTEQLKVSILGTSLTSVKVDPEAYNLLLKARKLSNQNSSESNNNATKLVKESIAIDSTYAPAWAILSHLFYRSAFNYGSMPMDEAIRDGKLAARKAIELDPNYVEGYLNLVIFETASWDFKSASLLIEKAKKLEPNNSSVIFAQSDFAAATGKIDLAIALFAKAKDIDPLFETHWYMGYYYWVKGQFGQAEESMNQSLFLHPNDNSANTLMGDIQLSLGHPEKALEYLEKVTEPFWQLYKKSKAVYAMGNTQEADALLEKLIADWGNLAWPNIADVYALRGEKDEAFKWLELAFDNKDISLLEILNYPSMKNLWGDSRWNTFINKLGLPKDHGFHMD